MQEVRRTTVRQLAGAKWVAPFHRVHKRRGWVHKQHLAGTGQLLRASSAATSPLRRITTPSQQARPHPPRLSPAAAACEAPPASSAPRRSRWPGDGRPSHAQLLPGSTESTRLAGSSLWPVCNLRISPPPRRSTHVVEPRNWSSAMQPTIVHSQSRCSAEDTPAARLSQTLPAIAPAAIGQRECGCRPGRMRVTALSRARAVALELGSWSGPSQDLPWTGGPVVHPPPLARHVRRVPHQEQRLD